MHDLIIDIFKASKSADWIEIRLDYLKDFDFSNPLPQLKKILASTTLPAILTLRPISQGGLCKFSLNERWQFWQQALQCNADLFDLELDLISAEILSISPEKLSKIIVSFHDFEKTPENLQEFVKRYFPTQICWLKIATQIRNTFDLFQLFELQKFLASKSIKYIIVGMGEAGKATRILGPAFGNFLTYSKAIDESHSAPSQISIYQMRNLYKVSQLTTDTPVTGLIGNPIKYSLSPIIHNSAFAESNLDWIYIPIEIQNTDEDLENFIRLFVHPKTKQVPWNSKGFSVTIPHKVRIIKFLDQLTSTAQKIGAVNTIMVIGNKLIGDNTDVEGAMRPLEKITPLSKAKVAVLGTGGAAHAIIYGLLQRKSEVVVFGRNLSKIKYLSEKFNITGKFLEDFDGKNFDGLINATPIGMTGFQSNFLKTLHLPIPLQKLEGLGWVYDLVYTPVETNLIYEAKKQGITTLNGIEMLVEQASLQFKAWTGKTPSVSAMKLAISLHHQK